VVALRFWRRQCLRSELGGPCCAGRSEPNDGIAAFAVRSGDRADLVFAYRAIEEAINPRARGICVLFRIEESAEQVAGCTRVRGLVAWRNCPIDPIPF